MKDKEKKAKLAYLEILAGNTAGNVEGIGKLKTLTKEVKSKAKLKK